MKSIYIKIKESANLNLSIIDDFKSIIEKYQNEIDFIEYHLNDKIDEPEYNLIQYLDEIISR